MCRQNIRLWWRYIRNTVIAELSQTYYIRPVIAADAQALLALVKLSTGGLSSLQPRLDFLKAYIACSQASFAGTKPADAPHKYLVGLFDPHGDRLIGCAAVKTQIGKDSPFINFDLQGDGENEYLIASSRYTGATEVGSLFLHPDYRTEGLGRYLAKVRYLLIAAEPWRFGETVIAELRGQCGAQGSPLYDYLFAEKLDISFLEADAEYYDRNPDALGDIVPIGKIPTVDFPVDVRASIGQAHPTGLGAMRLLQSEGFIFSGTIDLFDAGPIMSVYRDTIRTIMNSQETTLSISPSAAQGKISLIATGGLQEFRAVITTAQLSENGVLVAPDVVHTLGCPLGQGVRIWQKPETTARHISRPKLLRAQV